MQQTIIKAINVRNSNEKYVIIAKSCKKGKHIIKEPINLTKITIILCPWSIKSQINGHRVIETKGN